MNSFVFNLTNRCNFKCKTCLRETSSEQDLAGRDIEKVLPILKTLGVQYIALTGGEPIQHPDFENILELLVNQGFRFSLVTNSWLYKKYLTSLEPFKQQVFYIAISLDGHNAELHDQNRVKGSFDRTVRAIQAFREAGYSVRLSYIVNKLNFTHFMETFRFIKQYDLDVNVGKVIATGSNQEWQISPPQAKALPLKINSVIKGYNQKITKTASLGLSSQLFFCSNFSTMRDITLRFDGKVGFCCDSLLDNEGAILGDINADRFEDILSRFGQAVGKIAGKRIEALTQGNYLLNNDCDFCNDVLKTTLMT